MGSLSILMQIMMKGMIYGLLLVGTQLLAQPVSTFSYKGKTLEVLEYKVLSSPIEFDAPVSDADDEQIKLFKSYFNPGSLTTYQSHYLPQDWFNPTEDEFLQWQQRIKEKQLTLQSIVHLRHHEDEFLVFQYVLKSAAYDIFQSSEFKRTPSGWKHTSQQNDAVADVLNRIGSVQINYYQQQAKQTNTIQLDVLQPDQQRTFVEKFNRTALFSKIETMLQDMGVSQVDIDIARTMFIQKDDLGLAEYIASQYKLDDIDFMNQVNAASGVQLYRSSRVQQD